MAGKNESERARMMREAAEARAAAGFSAKRTFSEWFENVFRPNYMWPTIIGVVLLAALFFLLTDFLWQIKPDFTITVGTIGLFREEDTDELKQLLEETIGDVNGDGEVNIVVDIYIAPFRVDTSTDDLGAGATGVNVVSGFSGYDDTASQMLQAFDIAFMNDEQNVLYLLDDAFAHRYDEDFFEYLSEYGYTTESPVFYPANGIPVMDRLLTSDETPFWFCLRGWSYAKKNDAKYAEYYDLAVRALNAIIAAE